MSATPFPGENIDLDVDDPRTVERQPARGVTLRHKPPSLNEGEMESRTPSIIDLNAELAKLTMLRGRTPQSTMADRKGSAARLAAYREGVLFATVRGERSLGTPSDRRRADSRPRRHWDRGNRRRGRAPIVRAPRRNDRCGSAGCVAPLSLFGRRDADVRDAQSQRVYRTRCRRPSDGRA